MDNTMKQSEHLPHPLPRGSAPRLAWPSAVNEPDTETEEVRCSDGAAQKPDCWFLGTEGRHEFSEPSPEKDLVAESEDPTADEGLSLEPSIWDSLLLVSLRKMDDEFVIPIRHSVILIVLGILNVLIQVSFIIALGTTMALSPIDANLSVALVSKRALHNQHTALIDTQNFITRTRQICINGDVYSRLNDFTGKVSAYLQGDTVAKVGWFTKGTTISTIATIIWTLSMAVEIRRICDLGAAVVNLKSNRKTPRTSSVNVHVNEDEDCLMVDRLSKLHKAIFLMLVLLPRLIIACLLLFYGCEWLADTLAISDMILNACALEIVKSVDEYLFDAIIGYHTRLVVENTRLSVTKKTDIEGRITAWLELFRILAVIAWIIVIYFGYIKAFRDDLEDVYKLMCKYEENVTWTAHPVTNLPYFADIGISKNASEISLSESMQCYSAATFEMIVSRTYQGKPPAPYETEEFLSNASIFRMLDGTAEHCKQESCPTVSISALDAMNSMSSDSFRRDESCADQVVHMSVLAAVCRREKYINNVPFFSNRTECSHFKDLCECPVDLLPHEECSAENYSAVIERYGVAYEWILTLTYMCPQTCGFCIVPSAAPEGGGAPGQGSGGGPGMMEPSGPDDAPFETGSMGPPGPEDSPPSSGQGNEGGQPQPGSENAPAPADLSSDNQQNSQPQTRNLGNGCECQDDQIRRMLQSHTTLLFSELSSQSQLPWTDPEEDVTVLLERARKLEQSKASLEQRNSELSLRVSALERSAERFAALLADRRLESLLANTAH